MSDLHDAMYRSTVTMYRADTSGHTLREVEVLELAILGLLLRAITPTRDADGADAPTNVRFIA